MMKPILFNTEMVRAILDGRKTVTRRLIKPDPPPRAPGEVVKARHCVDGMWAFYVYDQKREWLYTLAPYKQPYEVGDILYVRETWADAGDFPGLTEENTVYAADYSNMQLAHLKDRHFRWRSSIHMPKNRARLFLRVTAVRAERLQDITADECPMEGVWPLHTGLLGDREEHYKMSFAKLWDSTVLKSELDTYGWKENPWVWVIKFEVCEKMEE